MTRKKTLPKSEEKQVVAYQKTPQEREAVGAVLAATDSKILAPIVKVNKNSKGVTEVSVDHPDPVTGWRLLQHSLATTSHYFANGIMYQLGNAVSSGQEVDQGALNFALAVVAGVKPKDELETMLAAQMTAIHMMTMTFARRLALAGNVKQQDSAERALNKLARTFTMQMEALKRYRTGGEQKVTVHHVTVNEGGQAIVGNVERSGDRGEG